MTEPSEEERRLMALTDQQLLDEISACDFDDPRSELLYGEAERRDLDI
jgi:hypothetical protein